MTVAASLDRTSLALDAGGTDSVRLVVRNDGNQVEGYRLEVVGEPAAWATVTPTELYVYPGAEQQAEVRFAPPRSSAVPAGIHAFGVRMDSLQQPEDVTVPEGRVEVLPYEAVSVELTPRTSHGRLGARHELAVDNRGNAPAEVALGGDDPDEAVLIAVRPDRLVVEPGQAAFARVRVRPTRRRWTGPPVTSPFRVMAVLSPTEARATDGAMVHDALLPRWLGKAVAVAAVVSALLAIAWMALLRPVVRTTAQDAVQEPVAAAKVTADRAATDAAGARTSAQAAGIAAGSATKTAGAASTDLAALLKLLIAKGYLKAGELPSSTPPGNGTGSQPAAPVGANYRKRLESDVAASATADPPTTVPGNEGRLLLLTDVFFENPQGDTGTVEMRIGSDLLFRKSLANFRDVDDHFVTPLALQPGETLTFAVRCDKPGPGQDRCRPALLLVGHEIPNPGG